VLRNIKEIKRLKQKERRVLRCGGILLEGDYLAMWYVRGQLRSWRIRPSGPPLGQFAGNNIPQMLWFCQSVGLAISAIVAPSLRCTGPGTISSLLPSRGVRLLEAFLLVIAGGRLLSCFLRALLGRPNRINHYVSRRYAYT
jgi:hypothetical protein